ncbi:response regulator transcription factor [Aridibaculum aurantiacum]|uniref:response regulator transcription factor n=1 Tax=Aridibaculum aurantiacum TaxID=2810307 RepID=UPI001A977D49|nr:response regulator [Aridibaculum aurantiacum]
MKPNILVVDDNEDILEFLSDELNEKYQVTTALNGNAALAVMKEAAIQLVVSDVMMPEVDGFELCKKIKSDFEHCHVPVILLTAKNTLQSKIQGLEHGADAYIEKPFDIEYLAVQIATLISNRNKVREYFIQSPLVHIKSIAHSKSDELFLENLNQVIFDNLDEPELDVDNLAKYMNMSRPTLFRKIKLVADLTPHELINLTRLRKAAELLAEGDYKIYEISNMVGYNSQTIFGRNFFKQFGCTPTEYQKKNQAVKK